MVIFYIIIILFISCASQGTPSGGAIDTDAPEIIDYYYKKSRFGNQIIIEFDEVIDPKSAVNAIKVNQSKFFRYKINYDKIIISDFNEQNGIVELYISRDLSDFQDNKLEKPINLFFSNNQSYFETEISGQLINIDESLIYEVALFRMDNKLTSFVKKTQSDNKGFFIFKNLDFGEYRLYAVEGKFSDYENDFRKLRYGIHSDELLISKNQESLNINIMIDEPLKRKEILRIKMIDKNNAEIIFLDGSSEHVFIRNKVNNSNFIIGDSITVRLKQENRLEKYTTKPFTFLTRIESQERLELAADTTFVEPVILNEIIESSEEKSSFKEGSLKGNVNYSGDYEVVVRLTSILDSLKYHTVVDSGIFEFNSVKAGKYILDSYEMKADNPENYYSGIWTPYTKSARFVIYPNEIEIRSRWLVEGIEVNYN